ncbi:zinc finger, PHD-type containing protein, partial [Tanacetum coccineum]
PDTVSHKYDKHQLTLRYFPVENYNGDYFCEVCAEEFNPNGAFYYCDQCVQSMHPACCVPILQKETTHTRFIPDIGVAQFDNVKFGDIYMHQHVVSLCRGVESDECPVCGEHLEDELILKCLQCKFAMDIDCADKFGDSFMVNGHPHVVSFCRGVESDGDCAKCGKDLQDKLIFKCLQCKFAIDIDCVLC